MLSVVRGCNSPLHMRMLWLVALTRESTQQGRAPSDATISSPRPSEANTEDSKAPAQRIPQMDGSDDEEAEPPRTLNRADQSFTSSAGSASRPRYHLHRILDCRALTTPEQSPPTGAAVTSHHQLSQSVRYYVELARSDLVTSSGVSMHVDPTPTVASSASSSSKYPMFKRLWVPAVRLASRPDLVTHYHEQRSSLSAAVTASANVIDSANTHPRSLEARSSSSRPAPLTLHAVPIDPPQSASAARVSPQPEPAVRKRTKPKLAIAQRAVSAAGTTCDVLSVFRSVGNAGSCSRNNGLSCRCSALACRSSSRYCRCGCAAAQIKSEA